MRGGTKQEKVKLEELIVNGTAVKDMDEIKKAVTEFWERTGGMYDSVEMNEVNLEIERKINEHMDVDTGRDEIAKFVKILKNGKAAGIRMNSVMPKKKQYQECNVLNK